MKTLPTLSSKGWIRTVEEQLDTVLTYYLSCNPSQTVLYNGVVVSLQYAIYRAAGDMDQLVRIVEDDLDRILTRYFPEGVSLSISYETVINTSLVNLNLAATVTKDTQRYDLARAINGIDSTFVTTQAALKILKL